MTPETWTVTALNRDADDNRGACIISVRLTPEHPSYDDASNADWPTDEEIMHEAARILGCPVSVVRFHDIGDDLTEAIYSAQVADLLSNGDGPMTAASPESELTRRAREVLANRRFRKSDREGLLGLVAYQRGEAMTWRADAGELLGFLRVMRLVDENGWPTDLGCEVARLLSEVAP